MADDRPNIVFVLTDEQHFSTLGYMGGDLVQTPHIDRLAAEGMWFDRAFCCTSICSPSRAALFTGRLPHRFGQVRNGLALAEGVPNLGQLLGDAGYRLGWSGKWHVDRNSVPSDHGFEGKDFPGYGYPFFLFKEDAGPRPDNDYYEYLVENGYGVPTLDDTYDTFLQDQPLCCTVMLHGRQSGPVEASIPYFVAQEGIELIRSFSERKRHDGLPFYTQINFWGPHNPCFIPEPYYSMYDPVEIAEPAAFGEDFSGKPTVHKRHSLFRGVYGAPWSFWQEHLAKYLGYCTLIDDQVGRIRAELAASGEWENTIFVFSTDHGDMMGRHQLIDKGPFMYDDTYRVPLVVAGPGVRRGRCDEFAYLHDLFPTLLDWAGAEPPEGIDLAQSLRPLLTGEAGWSAREEVFCEFDEQAYPMPQRMVRTAAHKLVFNAADICELYDLERDPHELDNRIDDLAYREAKRDLLERLLAYQRATGDPEMRRLEAIHWAL